MPDMFSLLSMPELLAAVAVTILASFVKGAIGFAMPMIMISGLATFVSADLALAMLIIPTLLANLVPALGEGVRAALHSARTFRRYLLVVLVFIALSAQLVTVLPQPVMFLALGIPITGFAAWQLAGRQIVLQRDVPVSVEIAVATVAGFVGGLTGVWGPPTVVYLSMIRATKDESVRVQGVINLAGACVLTLAHLKSGVLNAQTIPLSLLMVLPAAVGMALGMKARGHMDERRFRRWTQIVLIVAGANLIRKGLIGL